MSKAQKQKLIGILIFTIFTMVLLALSLPAIEMRPGEIISLQNSEQSFFRNNQVPANVDWFFLFIQGILAVLIILTPVHIIISLFDKEARRRLFSNLVKYGLIFVFGLSLARLQLPSPTGDNPPLLLQPGFAEPLAFAGDTVTPPGFEANPQPWMLAITMIGVALFLAFITFILFKFINARQPNKRPQFQELAETAQTALDEIVADRMHFNDVITRCYVEMSQTLKAESGIERQQTMTPQEFEQELTLKGFPPQPVQNLTQLFQQVRYGRHQPPEKEKRIATESLREMIDFCRREP
jgi:hypothetical protein